METLEGKKNSGNNNRKGETGNNAIRRSKEKSEMERKSREMNRREIYTEELKIAAFRHH